MLKLGANLLQAIGNFNGKLWSNSNYKRLGSYYFRVYPKRTFNLCLGHYVIAVAIMGTAPLPDSSVLQDYVQTVVSTVDPGIATIMKGSWYLLLLFFVLYSIYLSLYFVIQLGCLA